MSGPFLPRYDAWKLKTPSEYEPEGDGGGPDPDAQRDEELDREPEGVLVQVDPPRSPGAGLRELSSSKVKHENRIPH
jgi:hypothetical protein